MQKELEDEIVRLPLALTKRQSEHLLTARHRVTKCGDFDDDDDDDEISGEDDEEDKSDFSSEQVNKSEMLNIRKQPTGTIFHPEKFELTPGENSTPSIAEGDMTNDPDVVLQTIPQDPEPPARSASVIDVKVKSPEGEQGIELGKIMPLK